MHESRRKFCVCAALALIAILMPSSAQTVSDLTARITVSNQQIQKMSQLGSTGLQQPLRARLPLVEQLIRSNPAQALSVTLDAATRERIVRDNPEAASLVESEGERTGILQAVIADNFKSKSSNTLWRLQTVDGLVEVYPTQGEDLRQYLRRKVTVKGVGTANVMAAQSTRLASPNAVAPKAEATSSSNYCLPTGEQRVATILVNFPGGTDIGSAATATKAAFLGVEPSVNTYLAEVSHGQASAGMDMYGPYQLSQSYTCNDPDSLFDAAIAAAKGDIDFSKYDHYAVVFGASSCSYDGLATLGCVNANSTITHPFSQLWFALIGADASAVTPGVAAHELGHNLGLMHANFLDFETEALGPIDYASGTTTYVDNEYSDLYSVMGDAYPMGPFNAQDSAMRLGWIPDTKMITADSSGTYQLAPAEGSSGVRALRALRDPYSGSYLWVEYHAPIGYYEPNLAAEALIDSDSGVSTNHSLFSGATIHYENGLGNESRSFLLNYEPGTVVTYNVTHPYAVLPTLLPGVPWSDPYSPLSLLVNRVSDSGLNLSVSYDTPCATLQLSNSGVYAYAGASGVLTITAPDSCSWQVSTATTWITLSGTTSGSGNASIPFTIAANTTTAQRQGYITAQRQSLAVVQEGPNMTVRGVSAKTVSGLTSQFNIKMSDIRGLSDISSAILQISANKKILATSSYSNACVALVYPNTTPAQFGLYDFSGNALGSITAGTNETLSNGNCTLYASGSSATIGSDEIDATLQIKFADSFHGPQTMIVSGCSTFQLCSTPIPMGTVYIKYDQQAAAPVISSNGGTFSAAQSVTITDATAGASIYYTLDGSTPTAGSTPYSAPISIDQTETVNAIAIASGMEPSAVASAAFTINLTAAPTPAISPASGTVYTTSLSVTISDTLSGAKIYYTIDGSTPTESSALYTSPVTVTKTSTVKAMAIAAGVAPSAVASATYNRKLAAPSISLAPGTYSAPQTITITDADSDVGKIMYSACAPGISNCTSSEYTGPFTITSTTNVNAQAYTYFVGGVDQSDSVNAFYTITPAAATPTFSVAAGAYTSAQTVTISDSTAGATIYYTTNGATPTTSSAVYSSPITVSSSETLEAIATAKGYATSPVASAAYVINLPQAATPTFSTTGGTYTSSQSVTISDTTPGATIYYTTNGTTPTTSSTVYSGPITVSSSETLEAIATASGYAASPLASAAYIINIPTNPVPVIGSMSPALAIAGSAAFTLTVNGSGFTSTSSVYWGTSSLATQYVSATKLTAQVAATNAASAGITSISVQTPAPGGGTSGSLQFEVDSSSSYAPTFTSTTVAVAAGAAASYPVTLPSAATSVSATCLNLPAGATCSYSSTTNAVTIATSSTTPKGTYLVTVVFTETVPGAATASILLPILLLPLFFLRKKLTSQGIWFSACLGLVLLAGAAFTIGCGGGGSGSTTTTPTNPTHQVTGSGTVTLTIQ